MNTMQEVKMTSREQLDNKQDDFLAFIKSMLKKGNMKEKWIDLILGKQENVEIYKNAFTHKSVDPVNNYELYELLGDKLVNTAVLEYMYNRFPQYRKSNSVIFFSRLIAKYCSKEEFKTISLNLNFIRFIVASEETHATRRKDILEDVFESFFGATNSIINKEIREGVGYAIIIDIVKYIFDNIEIKTEYTDLFDSKTILKEFFDAKETKELFGIPVRGTEGGLKYKEIVNKPLDDKKVHGSVDVMIQYEIKQTYEYRQNDYDAINMAKNSHGQYIYQIKNFIDLMQQLYNLGSEIVDSNVISNRNGRIFIEITSTVILSKASGNKKDAASELAAKNLLHCLGKLNLYDKDKKNNDFKDKISS
jgi:dsRNA-specific ribonuclease